MTDEAEVRPPLSPDPPAPPGQEDLVVPDLPLPDRDDREVPQGADDVTEKAGATEAPD
ncbi:hypothetical protein OHA21_50955 [Actinoplanes sp. NBC_00393]|uniref:hypothetical protein n=1 Tax=Actinoplanes sp. NBC_00393 TaxID=2975953 RepID=UPI002E1D37FB